MAQSGPVAFDKEIRLGLVLYGGVSLAVYENGKIIGSGLNEDSAEKPYKCFD